MAERHGEIRNGRETEIEILSSLLWKMTPESTLDAFREGDIHNIVCKAVSHIYDPRIDWEQQCERFEWAGIVYSTARYIVETEHDIVSTDDTGELFENSIVNCPLVVVHTDTAGMIGFRRLLREIGEVQDEIFEQEGIDLPRVRTYVHDGPSNSVRPLDQFR